jgi:hypothetical protein
MNLPLQREPVQRLMSCQATGEHDATAAMLASGVNPSEYGVQPDGVIKTGLPLLAGMI